MMEENKGPAAGGQEMPASSAPDSGAAGSSAASPQVTAVSRGGSTGNWFARHKVLTGVVAGLLAAMLLGGMFAIGYAVGKPEGKRRVEITLPERLPPRDLPQRRAPLRERVGERLEELQDYRGELKEMVASELGISVEELEDELAGGKSVAELAEDKGVSTEELIERLAAKIEEMADRLVSEGKISESRGERIKDRSDALASLLVHGGYRLFLRRAAI